MDITKLKSAKLRDAESMLAYLREVNDVSDLREGFYPLLTVQAGRQLNGAGVMIVLQLVIADYARGMPVMMRAFLNSRIDDFARAIMPDDEVVNDAKRIHAEVEKIVCLSG